MHTAVLTVAFSVVMLYSFPALSLKEMDNSDCRSYYEIRGVRTCLQSDKGARVADESTSEEEELPPPNENDGSTSQKISRIPNLLRKMKLEHHIRGHLTILTEERKTQFGFTLIEIAIVLVIGGLLLSAILGVVSAQRTNVGISATKAKEEAIKTAFISFVSRNQRLPCPAVANLVPTNPGYGVEAPNPGSCDGTTNFGGVPNTVFRGIVPWVSLGLSDACVTPSTR